MEEFQIKVENVVSNTALGTQIELNKLVAKVDAAEYEPEQFPGLVYRVTDPKAAALIFSTGKIVCTGTKRIEDSRKALKKVVHKLREVGILLPNKYTIHTENIVASTKIDAELKPEEITFLLENSEYDPEQFPGVIYSIQNPAVTFLIFRTGKIIVTGGKTIDEIFTALEILRKKLVSLGINVVPAVD